MNNLALIQDIRTKAYNVFVALLNKKHLPTYFYLKISCKSCYKYKNICKIMN